MATNLTGSLRNQLSMTFDAGLKIENDDGAASATYDIIIVGTSA